MLTKTKLGDVIKLKSGKSIKPGGAGKYPVYGSNGKIGGSDEYKYENAIIIGRVGAYCGSIEYSEGKFWASDNTLIAQPSSVNYDIKYLSYLLRSLNLRRYAGGSAQPLMTQTVIKSIEVDIPETKSQIKIGRTLSAYDDLIENNSRRIENLEAMARLIYLDSVKDLVVGTELSEITDLIARGISPKYDDNGNSVVINQRCIRDQKINLAVARRQSKTIPTNKLVRSGDVLVNSTGVGTLGRVAQVFGNFNSTTVDSHVTIVRPDDKVNPYFFGAALLSQQEEFERLGIGATGQTELGREAIGRVTIPIIGRDTQNQVGSKIQKIRALINNLSEKNLKLAQARDLLLPRLISGEVKL